MKNKDTLVPSYLDHRNHVLEEAISYADGMDKLFGSLPYKEMVALTIKELGSIVSENVEYVFALSPLAEESSLERTRCHLLRTIALSLNTLRALDKQTGEFDTIMGAFNNIYNTKSGGDY